VARRIPYTAALALLALAAAPAAAQEWSRLTLLTPGNPKPVVLYADEVVTWADNGHQVVRLEGRVLVEQGTVAVRAARVVAWIDTGSYQRTRMQEVKVFAEGEARVANGDRVLAGDRFLVELATRGEVRLKSQGSKIVREPRPDDPLYRASRAVALAPPAAPVQPAGGVPPATPGPGLRPTGATEPLFTPGPLPPAPKGLPRPTPTIVPPAAVPRTSTSMRPSDDPGPPGGTVADLPPPGTGPPDGVALPAPRPLTPAGPSVAGSPALATDGPEPPPEPLPRVVSIAPRAGSDFNVKTFWLPSGEQAIVVSGGVILMVRNVKNVGLIDMEADRLVIYTRDDSAALLGAMRTGGGATNKAMDFYLSGNVEIRSGNATATRTLRADQVYYDVSRNTAVAVSADLEVRQQGYEDPLHFKADELLQLNSTQFEAVRAEFFSSKLPSDPGVRVVLADAKLDQKRVVRRSILGIPFRDRRTGEVEMTTQQLVRGKNTFITLGGVPIFYTPYFIADADDPLGPLKAFSFGQDRIFGTQVFVTLDVFKLFGVNPPPNTRWSLDLDNLSERGFALGTDFNYAVRDTFGIENARSRGLGKAWGLKDDGIDVLGGGRPSLFTPGDYRGRVLLRDFTTLPDQDINIQSQVSLLSDKNFLEQYYKNEFDSDINQETYIFATKRDGVLWGGVELRVNIRDWVTEDVRLPRLTGAALGVSPFNIFTYNVRGEAGYAQLRTTNLPPPPLLSTEQEVRTGRFDLFQDLSVPFRLGAAKIVPYGVLDLTQYTDDLNANGVGRVYAGGGVRGSLPLTRLYPNVQSEFFNLQGINHKIVLAGNYFATHSNVPYTQLPLLDRLQDDATDQAIRDITPMQAALNRQNGQFLATSPIFNPQLYAIRRLVDNRIDTLDTIQVVQGSVLQRWQTKRGFPGIEHIVDYVTLDLSGSFFPNPAADNFGESVAFGEYDFVWNVGDRTSIVSTGWFDPFAQGVRYYTIGASLNRNDRTNVFIGYRHTDPINSRAVTGSLTYVLGPKYAVSGSSTYDFGTQQALTNTLSLTRVGTDLSVTVGLTYNVILNNLGFTFEVLPNAVAATGRRGYGGIGLGGNNQTNGGLLNR
jgi:lipopolysaccharide export system protein LptA